MTRGTLRILARAAAAPPLLLASASPLFAAADPARYMPAELIAESPAPAPGSTILVGFKMTPRPGWHGYWSNPGESGIAPTVRWTAPAGVRFGPLLHPAPTLIGADGISSFVHEGPHVLLARMTLDRSIAAGTPIPVKARLDWAACTATQCVPLHATFTLDLVAGNGADGPNAAALAEAANKVPETAPASTFVADGKALRLLLPASLRLDTKRAKFFPDGAGAFPTADASGHEADGTAWIVAPRHGDIPRRLTGVVSDGGRAFRIAFTRVAEIAGEKPTAAEAAPIEPETGAPAAVTPAPARKASASAQPSREHQVSDWSRFWPVLALVGLAGAAVAGWRRLVRRT